MDIKPRPQHRLYILSLRKMTPEQRLLKAFELSDFTRQLFVQGLHNRFPNASGTEFNQILKTRLEKCHNRNY